MKQSINLGIFHVFFSIGIFVLGNSALAQDSGYPSRAIRIIIPTAPGGAMDGTARLIAEKLTDAWKQPVIVDNRAGGNGAIAYGAVAKSQPDGYTIGMTLSSLVQTILLSKSPPYNLSELAPVALVAMLPNGFAVGANVPATNMQQYIEWARKQPAGVDYGTAGAGSSGNIMGGTLAKAAGIGMVHIPFKGEAPAIQAMLGGDLKAMFGATGSLAAQAQTGKMRLIAVALPNRLRDFPDVPTFAEVGYPAVNLPGWSMTITPSATPRTIQAKLSAEISRIVRLPDVSARILGYGFQPEGGTPEAAKKFLDDELLRWGTAIKASGVVIE